MLARQTITRDLVLGYWDEVMRGDADELQTRIQHSLESLDVPVLALYGHDTPSEREYLHAHLADVTVEEWPGCGHMLHLVDPDRFAARLTAFVDACSR